MGVFNCSQLRTAAAGAGCGLILGITAGTAAAMPALPVSVPAVFNVLGLMRIKPVGPPKACGA
jgi:hypothetical protein